MPSTDTRVVWPSEIKWTTKKILTDKGSTYSYEEAYFDSVHLAFHPGPFADGSFMRVEVAWGKGSTFQHMLFSMQIHSTWPKKEFIERVRDALVAMELVKLPEPEPTQVDPRD